VAISEWPPTPQILNLPALEAADANADVVVNWNGFTGAGANDSISFSIQHGGKLIFLAPDPCVPRELDKRATSIVVPKGTLAAGQVYDAQLNYSHFGMTDTNTIPDIPAFTMFFKEVSFKIITGGGTPGTQPRITSVILLPDGHLQLTIQGDPGKSYTLEATPALMNPSWVGTGTMTLPASGQLVYDAGFATGAERYFRLKAN
jgi:hypothetical protein